MMKMVMALVPREQTDQVLEALIAAGHTATFTGSRSGVLRQAQHMLFIATEDDSLNNVLDIIRANCHTKVKVGSGIGSLFHWLLYRGGPGISNRWCGD